MDVPTKQFHEETSVPGHGSIATPATLGPRTSKFKRTQPLPGVPEGHLKALGFTENVIERLHKSRAFSVESIRVVGKSKEVESAGSATSTPY